MLIISSRPARPRWCADCLEVEVVQPDGGPCARSSAADRRPLVVGRGALRLRVCDAGATAAGPWSGVLAVSVPAGAPGTALRSPHHVARRDPALRTVSSERLAGIICSTRRPLARPGAAPDDTRRR